MSEGTTQEVIVNGVVDTQVAFLKSQLQVNVKTIKDMTRDQAKAFLDRLIEGEDRPKLRAELLALGATDTRVAQKKDYKKLFTKAMAAAIEAADAVEDDTVDDIGYGIGAAVVVRPTNHGFAQYLLAECEAVSIREKVGEVEVKVKDRVVKKPKFKNSVLMPISVKNQAKGRAAAHAFAATLVANKVKATAQE